MGFRWLLGSQILQESLFSLQKLTVARYSMRKQRAIYRYSVIDQICSNRIRNRQIVCFKYLHIYVLQRYIPS